MPRINGAALFFDEEEVKETTALLPRLIRVFMFGLGITNDGYLERYWRYFRDTNRDKTRKIFSQKATTDRKFLADKTKVTFSLMSHAVEAMGYDIEAVSMRVRDRTTGEVMEFSTDDTAEELKEKRERKNSSGIQSIQIG